MIYVLKNSEGMMLVRAPDHVTTPGAPGARDIAAASGGKIWRDEAQTTCRPLLTTGEPCVVAWLAAAEEG